MSPNIRRPMRVVSLFLAVILISNDFAYAAPELSSSGLFAPKAAVSGLPYSVGVAEERFQAASPKVLYLIQDAHTNPSAQKNIAKTIEHLAATENVRTVFIEGGFGDDSLTAFRGAEESKKKITAQSYLAKGEMSGSEYASLLSDKILILRGVEDKTLYRRSLEVYGRIAKNRERFCEYLQRIRQTVDSLKSQIYGPELQAFEKKNSSYRSGSMPATDYYAALMAEAAARMLPLEAYPHFSALSILIEKEGKVDFEQAGREEVAALKEMSDSDLAELKLAAPAKVSSKDPKELRAFCALLEEKLTAAGRLKEFPELSRYFEYLKAWESLDARRLAEEEKKLEDAVYASLAVSDDERGLVRVAAMARELEGLFDLTLTPDEFDAYRRESRDLDITYLTGWLNRKIMDLGGQYERAVFMEKDFAEFTKTAEEFYTLTRQRDEYFVSQALAAMSASGEGKAILVAGGYHAPNLKSLLKARGVSFVSIAPQVLHPTNLKRYEKILLTPAFSDNRIAPLAVMERPDGPYLSRFALARELPAPVLSGARLISSEGQRSGDKRVGPLVPAWREMDDTYRQDAGYASRGLAVYRAYLGPRFDKDLSRLAKEISSGKRNKAVVLDVGAGSGLPLHEILAEVDPSQSVARGIGISMSEFKHLHKRFPNEAYVLANVFESLPVSTSSVSLGVSVAGPAPRNIERLRSLVEEIGRALDAQGVFYYQIEADDKPLFTKNRSILNPILRKHRLRMSFGRGYYDDAPKLWVRIEKKKPLSFIFWTQKAGSRLVAFEDLKKLNVNYRLSVPRAPFIVSNEEGTEKLIEKMAAAPKDDHSRLHVGFAGFLNLDIMAARKSDYGILLDVNEREMFVWDLVAKSIGGSETAAEFIDRFVEGMKAKDAESPGYFFEGMRGVPLDSNGKPDMEAFREEFRESGAEKSANQIYWLRNPEYFRHIRWMFQQGRIIYFQANILDTDTFRRMGRATQKLIGAADTVYLSNIREWVTGRRSEKNVVKDPAENNRKVNQSLVAVSGKKTYFIEAKRTRESPDRAVVYFYNAGSRLSEASTLSLLEKIQGRTSGPAADTELETLVRRQEDVGKTFRPLDEIVSSLGQADVYPKLSDAVMLFFTALPPWSLRYELIPMLMTAVASGDVIALQLFMELLDAAGKLEDRSRFNAAVQGIADWKGSFTETLTSAIRAHGIQLPSWGGQSGLGVADFDEATRAEISEIFSKIDIEMDYLERGRVRERWRQYFEHIKRSLDEDPEEAVESLTAMREELDGYKNFDALKASLDRAIRVMTQPHAAGARLQAKELENRIYISTYRENGFDTSSPDLVQIPDLGGIIRKFFVMDGGKNTQDLMSMLFSAPAPTLDDIELIAVVNFQRGRFLRIHKAMIVLKDGRTGIFTLNIPTRYGDVNLLAESDYRDLVEWNRKEPALVVKPLILASVPGQGSGKKPINVFALEWLGNHIELNPEYPKYPKNQTPYFYLNGHGRDSEEVQGLRVEGAAASTHAITAEIAKALTLISEYDSDTGRMRYPEQVATAAGDFMFTDLGFGRFGLKLITVRAVAENSTSNDFLETLLGGKIMRIGRPDGFDPGAVLLGVAQGLYQKYGAKGGQAIFRRWLDSFEDVVNTRIRGFETIRYGDNAIWQKPGGLDPDFKIWVDHWLSTTDHFFPVRFTIEEKILLSLTEGAFVTSDLTSFAEKELELAQETKAAIQKAHEWDFPVVAARPNTANILTFGARLAADTAQGRVADALDKIRNVNAQEKPMLAYLYQLELLAALGILKGNVFYPAMGDDALPGYFADTVFGVNRDTGMQADYFLNQVLEGYIGNGLPVQYQLKRPDVRARHLDVLEPERVETYFERLKDAGKSIDVVYLKEFTRWVNSNDRSDRAKQIQTFFRYLDESVLKPGGFVVLMTGANDDRIIDFLIRERGYRDVLAGMSHDDPVRGALSQSLARKPLVMGERHTYFIAGLFKVRVLQKPAPAPAGTRLSPTQLERWGNALSEMMNLLSGAWAPAGLIIDETTLHHRNMFDKLKRTFYRGADASVGLPFARGIITAYWDMIQNAPKLTEPLFQSVLRGLRMEALYDVLQETHGTLERMRVGDPEAKNELREELEEINFQLAVMRQNNDTWAYLFPTAQDAIAWHAMKLTKPDSAWRRYIENIAAADLTETMLLILGGGFHTRQGSDTEDLYADRIIMAKVMPRLKERLDRLDGGREMGNDNAEALKMTALILNALFIHPKYDTPLGQKVDKMGRLFDFKMYKKYFDELMDSVGSDEDSRKVLERAVRRYPKLLGDTNGPLPAYLTFADKKVGAEVDQDGRSVAELFRKHYNRMGGPKRYSDGPAFMDIMLPGDHEVVKSFFEARALKLPNSLMAILLEIRQEMQSGRLFDKNWDGNTLEDAGSRLARDTSKLRVVEQAYDAVAPEYGQGVDPKTSELLDDFVSMLPADAPVLDAGTGTGRNLSWMAGRLAELGDARPLLGADLSGGMLSQAHERTGLKNLMKMDLVQIAFPGNFFAGVVCYTVIHLMSDEDLATALDEFWRVLVDGGVLFIYAKVADSRRLQQDDQVPGFVSPESSAGQLYAQRPVNRHDQDWLRSIFVSKGFRVLKEGSSQDGMGTGRAYFYLTPSNKADLMLLSAEYERLKSLGRPLPLREAHNIITLLGPEEEQVTLNFGTELAGKVALVAPKRAGSEYYIHTLADAEFNNAILIGYRKGDDRITLFEPSSSTVESVAIPKNRWFSPEMLKESRIVRTFENKVFSRYYDNPANRMALIKERLRLTAPAGGHAGAWEATRGASRVTYRSFRLLLPSMSKKKWVDRNFHYLRTGSSRGEEKIPTAILLGKSLADADALAASEAFSYFFIAMVGDEVRIYDESQSKALRVYRADQPNTVSLFNSRDVVLEQSIRRMGFGRFLPGGAGARLASKNVPVNFELTRNWFEIWESVLVSVDREKVAKLLSDPSLVRQLISRNDSGARLNAVLIDQGGEAKRFVELMQFFDSLPIVPGGDMADGSLYEPTSWPFLNEIFHQIQIASGRPVAGMNYLSFGSGDLRDAAMAAYVYGMKATAAEKDEDMAVTAARYASQPDNSRFFNGVDFGVPGAYARDGFDLSWKDFDVVYFYYTQPRQEAGIEFRRRFLEKVREMKPGALLVVLYASAYIKEEQDPSFLKGALPLAYANSYKRFGTQVRIISQVQDPYAHRLRIYRVPASTAPRPSGARLAESRSVTSLFNVRQTAEEYNAGIAQLNDAYVDPDHVRNSSKLILRGAQGLTGTALLLGLGLGTDYTIKGLEALARQFDKLVVLDIDEKTARATVERLPRKLQRKFDIRLMDFSGMLQELSDYIRDKGASRSLREALSDIKNFTRSHVERLRLYDGNGTFSADYVVSSLIAAQIPILPEQWITNFVVLKSSGNAATASQNENLIAAIETDAAQLRRLLQIGHIHDLRSWVKQDGRVFFADSITNVDTTFDPHSQKLAEGEQRAMVYRAVWETVGHWFDEVFSAIWTWDAKLPKENESGVRFIVKAKLLSPVNQEFWAARRSWKSFFEGARLSLRESDHVMLLGWMLDYAQDKGLAPKKNAKESDIMLKFFRDRRVLNIGLETLRGGGLAPRNILKELRGKGIEAFAIDPQGVSTQGHIKGVVENMPFKDNYFDDAVSVGLFDPIFIDAIYKNAASEIRRVLKDGGIFYLNGYGQNQVFVRALEKAGFEKILLNNQETYPSYAFINHKAGSRFTRSEFERDFASWLSSDAGRSKATFHLGGVAFHVTLDSLLTKHVLQARPDPKQIMDRYGLDVNRRHPHDDGWYPDDGVMGQVLFSYERLTDAKDVDTLIIQEVQARYGYNNIKQNKRHRLDPWRDKLIEVMEAYASDRGMVLLAEAPVKEWRLAQMQVLSDYTKPFRRLKWGIAVLQKFRRPYWIGQRSADLIRGRSAVAGSAGARLAEKARVDRVAHLIPENLKLEETQRMMLQNAADLAVDVLAMPGVDRILVAGSGQRFLTALLAGAGKKVTFIDINVDAVLLEQHIFNSIAHIDGAQRPVLVTGELGRSGKDWAALSKHSYDAILMPDLYGDKPVGDPRNWFETVKALLSPNGYILIDEGDLGGGSMMEYMLEAFDHVELVTPKYYFGDYNYNTSHHSLGAIAGASNRLYRVISDSSSSSSVDLLQSARQNFENFFLSSILKALIPAISPILSVVIQTSEDKKSIQRIINNEVVDLGIALRASPIVLQFKTLYSILLINLQYYLKEMSVEVGEDGTPEGKRKLVSRLQFWMQRWNRTMTYFYSTPGFDAQITEALGVEVNRGMASLNGLLDSIQAECLNILDRAPFRRQATSPSTSGARLSAGSAIDENRNFMHAQIPTIVRNHRVAKGARRHTLDGVMGPGAKIVWMGGNRDPIPQSYVRDGYLHFVITVHERGNGLNGGTFIIDSFEFNNNKGIQPNKERFELALEQTVQLFNGSGARLAAGLSKPLDLRDWWGATLYDVEDLPGLIGKSAISAFTAADKEFIDGIILAAPVHLTIAVFPTFKAWRDFSIDGRKRRIVSRAVYMPYLMTACFYRLWMHPGPTMHELIHSLQMSGNRPRSTLRSQIADALRRHRYKRALQLLDEWDAAAAAWQYNPGVQDDEFGALMYQVLYYMETGADKREIDLEQFDDETQFPDSDRALYIEDSARRKKMKFNPPVHYSRLLAAAFEKTDVQTQREIYGILRNYYLGLNRRMTLPAVLAKSAETSRAGKSGSRLTAVREYVYPNAMRAGYAAPSGTAKAVSVALEPGAFSLDLRTTSGRNSEPFTTEEEEVFRDPKLLTPIADIPLTREEIAWVKSTNYNRITGSIELRCIVMGKDGKKYYSKVSGFDTTAVEDFKKVSLDPLDGMRTPDAELLVTAGNQTDLAGNFSFLSDGKKWKVYAASDDPWDAKPYRALVEFRDGTRKLGEVRAERGNDNQPQRLFFKSFGEPETVLDPSSVKFAFVAYLLGWGDEPTADLLYEYYVNGEKKGIAESDIRHLFSFPILRQKFFFYHELASSPAQLKNAFQGQPVTFALPSDVSVEEIAVALKRYGYFQKPSGPVAAAPGDFWIEGSTITLMLLHNRYPINALAVSRDGRQVAVVNVQGLSGRQGADYWTFFDWVKKELPWAYALFALDNGLDPTVWHKDSEKPYLVEGRKNINTVLLASPSGARLAGRDEEKLQRLGMEVDGEFIRYSADYRQPALTYDLSIIAHGSTPNNALNVFHGITDNENSLLAPGGVEEVRRGAQRWWQKYGDEFMAHPENFIFLRSPLRRTGQSFDIYREVIREKSGRDIEVIVDPGVREIDFGLWDGLTIDEIGKKHGEAEKSLAQAYRDGNVFVRSSQGGETFVGRMAAVRDWMLNQNEKFAGKKVFLFGHGTFKKAAATVLKNPEVPLRSDGTINTREYEYSRGYATLMHAVSPAGARLAAKESEWVPVHWNDAWVQLLIAFAPFHGAFPKLRHNEITGKNEILWVNGPTLEQWARGAGAQLDNFAFEKQIVEWSINLGYALAILSLAGAQHGDFTGRNVIVDDETGEPVLIDFNDFSLDDQVMAKSFIPGLLFSRALATSFRGQSLIDARDIMRAVCSEFSDLMKFHDQNFSSTQDYVEKLSAYAVSRKLIDEDESGSRLTSSQEEPADSGAVESFLQNLDEIIIVGNRRASINKVLSFLESANYPEERVRTKNSIGEFNNLALTITAAREKILVININTTRPLPIRLIHSSKDGSQFIVRNLLGNITETDVEQMFLGMGAGLQPVRKMKVSKSPSRRRRAASAKKTGNPVMDALSALRRAATKAPAFQSLVDQGLGRVNDDSVLNFLKLNPGFYTPLEIARVLAEIPEEAMPTQILRKTTISLKKLNEEGKITIGQKDSRYNTSKQKDRPIYVTKKSRAYAIAPDAASGSRLVAAKLESVVSSDFTIDMGDDFVADCYVDDIPTENFTTITADVHRKGQTTYRFPNRNGEIYISVYHPLKLIEIHSFYPRFPSKEYPGYKEGRGRDLLRRILLHSNRYAGYAIASAASPQFQDSFMKIGEEFQPVTVRSDKRRFQRVMDSWREEISKNPSYPFFVVNELMDATLHGIVPPAGSRLARKYINVWGNLIYDPETGKTGIIFGHSGIGKTTLSYYLNQKGFRILWDDSVYVKLSGGRVLATANVDQIAWMKSRDSDFDRSSRKTKPISVGPAKGLELSVEPDNELRPVDFVVYLQDDDAEPLDLFLRSNGFIDVEESGHKEDYPSVLVHLSAARKDKVVTLLDALPKVTFAHGYRDEQEKLLDETEQIRQLLKSGPSGARLAEPKVIEEWQEQEFRERLRLFVLKLWSAQPQEAGKEISLLVDKRFAQIFSIQYNKTDDMLRFFVQGSSAPLIEIPAARKALEASQKEISAAPGLTQNDLLVMSRVAAQEAAPFVAGLRSDYVKRIEVPLSYFNGLNDKEWASQVSYAVSRAAAVRKKHPQIVFFFSGEKVLPTQRSVALIPIKENAARYGIQFAEPAPAEMALRVRRPEEVISANPNRAYLTVSALTSGAWPNWDGFYAAAAAITDIYAEHFDYDRGIRFNEVDRLPENLRAYLERHAAGKSEGSFEALILRSFRGDTTLTPDILKQLAFWLPLAEKLNWQTIFQGARLAEKTLAASA